MRGEQGGRDNERWRERERELVKRRGRVGEREGGRRSDYTGQAVTQFQESICEAQQGQTDHGWVMTGTGAGARSGPRMSRGWARGWARSWGWTRAEPPLEQGQGLGQDQGWGKSWGWVQSRGRTMLGLAALRLGLGGSGWGSRGRWEVRVGALGSGEVVNDGARTERHGS